MSSPPDGGRVGAASSIEPIPSRTRLVAAGALLIGGVLIWATLEAGDGSGLFYAAGFTLAGVWASAAALATPADRRSARWTDVVVGAVTGACCFGLFVAAFFVARRIGLLEDQVGSLLDAADRSALAPVLTLALANAVTEELFFRGTLIDAVRPARRWAAGIVPYALATAPSGNVALVLAAIVMGAVFTALRLMRCPSRRLDATHVEAPVRNTTPVRSTLATPIACHVTWSLLMLLAFPRP